MTATALAGFLLLTAVAAYVQTLTGFAFGLIAMGGVGLLGIMSLPDAAVLVSILVLANAAQVLAKGWRDVAWRLLGLTLAGSIPGLVAGYALLHVLADDRAAWLRLILGVLVIVSSQQLLLANSRRQTVSSTPSFIVYGALGGIMGGLFSTSGPPVVYHLHRQHLGLVRVRETLVTLFAFNSLLRLGLVIAGDDMPKGSVWWGLLALPLVTLSTYAARRWPPPLSRAATTRIVVALLFASGASLAFPAARQILAPERPPARATSTPLAVVVAQQLPDEVSQANPAGSAPPPRR